MAVNEIKTVEIGEAGCGSLGHVTGREGRNKKGQKAAACDNPDCYSAVNWGGRVATEMKRDALGVHAITTGRVAQIHHAD